MRKRNFVFTTVKTVLLGLLVWQNASGTAIAQGELPNEWKLSELPRLFKDFYPIVTRAGQYRAAPAQKDEIQEVELSESEVPSDLQDKLKTFKFIREVHDGTQLIEEVTNLGANDNTLWPGNIIRGDKVFSFIYTPLVFRRSPITLSIGGTEATTTATNVSLKVENPSLSTVRQAINDLVSQAESKGALPAKIDFTYKEVKHQAEVDKFLKGKVNYGGNSIGSTFDFKSKDKKHKYIARFRSVYFTVDVNHPEYGFAQFVSPQVSKEEFEACVPVGSSPLYVSSVSYGMMAVMVIESESSISEFMAALETKNKSGALKVDAEAELKSKNVLENSSVKTYIYGGSSNEAVDLQNGYESFKKVIESSRTFSADSPGVPLAYKFNAADGTLAQISQTTQYSFLSPIRIKEKVKISLVGLVCTKSDDEGPNNDADMDRLSISIRHFAQIDVNSQSVELTPRKGTAAATPQSLINWSTSGEMGVSAGRTYWANGGTPVICEFDTATYDFDLSEIRIDAYAREFDDVGSSETGTSSYKIQGPSFFKPSVGPAELASNPNLDKHIFDISSPDFAFNVILKIERVE